MAIPHAAASHPPKGNGLAVAGMVLGIIGLVLCWIPFVGAACALIGLILSALGMSKANKGASGKGMAIAGLVCGIVGLIASVVFTWMTMVAVKGFDDYMKKAKTSEAKLHLRSIETKIKAFYNEKSRLPKSASMMPGPGGSACQEPGAKLSAKPQSAWDAVGWNEMGFHVDEDSRYSYQWTSNGPQGGEAIAVADLDCDGTVSTTTLKIDVVEGVVRATYLDPTPD
jgi:hypothetical protein